MKSVCIWSWTGFDGTDRRFLPVKNMLQNIPFLSPLMKGTDSFCIWHDCDPNTAKETDLLLCEAVSSNADNKWVLLLNRYPNTCLPQLQQGQLSGGTPASARTSHTDSQQWIPWIQSLRGTTSVSEECCHQITTLRMILKLLKILSQYLNVTATWSNKWWIIYIIFPRLGLPSVIYTSDAGFGSIPVLSLSSKKAGNNNH